MSHVAAVSVLFLSLNRRTYTVSVNYHLPGERRRHRRTGQSMLFSEMWLARFVSSCSSSLQPPLQDAAAVYLSDAGSLKHTDLLSQKSELLTRHALFVAGFFGWSLPMLEGG